MPSLLRAAMLLAASAGLILPAAAAETMEIDLVFPRNESYAPTDYFPTVFAIRKPQLINKLSLSISTDAWRWPGRSDYIDMPVFHMPEGINETTPDPLFLYSYIPHLTSGSEYLFQWGIQYQNCSDTATADGGFKSSNVTSNGIVFTISDGAQKVDLAGATSDSACKDKTQSYALNVTDALGQCAVLSQTTPMPVPDPCGVTINDTAATSISSGIMCQATGPGTGIHPCDDATTSGAASSCVRLAWLPALLAGILVTVANGHL